MLVDKSYPVFVECGTKSAQRDTSLPQEPTTHAHQIAIAGGKAASRVMEGMVSTNVRGVRGTYREQNDTHHCHSYGRIMLCLPEQQSTSSFDR